MTKQWHDEDTSLGSPEAFWGHFGAILDPLCDPLEAISDPFMGHLGSSCDYFGPAWVLLGPSLVIVGPLGASLGPLGAIMDRPGALLLNALDAVLEQSWDLGPF